MDDGQLVVGESVTRTFGAGRGSITAIEGATFSIRAGSHVAIVGPSGSGKSTLLHLIAGLDEPTSGTIRWPGLGERSELRPGLVGVAFQGPSLLPPLSIAENVELPAMLNGGPDGAGTGAAASMRAFEVEAVADKLPEEVSGGQAQRAGLARAFVAGRRLILADEPTGQQDRATAARILDAMLTIARREGITLVIATHDEMVASRMPVRWAIHSGRIATEAA